MAIDRDPLSLGDSDTEPSVDWENEFKGKINDVTANAVDSTDGKVNASQVEIDADATAAGDRSLIMRLTASLTRVLSWVNASSGFRLTDQGGSTLYPLEVATATLSSHAATKAQVDDSIRRALSIQGSNYSVTAGDLGKVLAGAGTLTLTLPDSSTLGSGWCCYFENISTGVVTIATTSQSIDGVSQITLGPRNGCFLHSLGVSGFGTVGRKPEYIQLRDQKSSGTAGGTFTSGAWRTRDLNTEVADTANNCVLSSNQFTLQPGTYRIFATAPAHSIAQHQAKLRNITDSSDTLIGTSQQNASGTQQQGISIVSGRFSISAAKTFELQHQCNTTRNTDGFGQAGSFATEVYAVVELWKEI